MRSRTPRCASGILSLATLALLGACGRGERTGAAAHRPELTGAGATFPYPLYSRWTSTYLGLADVRINYLSVGSAEGVRLLARKNIDFAGSDVPLARTALDSLACGGALQIPTVAGAIAVAYNVPGLDTLITLDRETLVGIFSGRITRWNAPEIARRNPAFRFPALPIRVVHRSSGSGTSAAFAAYLAGSPRWVRRSPDDLWPVGVSEEGNEGVAARVRQTAGAIGYMEIAYARQNLLRTARLLDREGQVVAPSVEGVRKALASLAPGALDGSVALIDAPAPGAYPVVAISWFVVPRTSPDAAQRDRLVSFLHWTLSGGADEAGTLEYVPLPRETVMHYDSLVGQIRTGPCPAAPSP
jgi:phosphate transport system substrate-binding protein